jgi:hypothetical protein
LSVFVVARTAKFGPSSSLRAVSLKGTVTREH